MACSIVPLHILCGWCFFSHERRWEGFAHCLLCLDGVFEEEHERTGAALWTKAAETRQWRRIACCHLEPHIVIHARATWRFGFYNADGATHTWLGDQGIQRAAIKAVVNEGNEAAKVEVGIRRKRLVWRRVERRVVKVLLEYIVLALATRACTAAATYFWSVHVFLNAALVDMQIAALFSRLGRCWCLAIGWGEAQASAIKLCDELWSISVGPPAADSTRRAQRLLGRQAVACKCG